MFAPVPPASNGVTPPRRLQAPAAPTPPPVGAPPPRPALGAGRVPSITVEAPEQVEARQELRRLQEAVVKVTGMW